MSDIQNDPIFNDIMARVANFTIGFLKLKNNGSDEDAICAGSGTLVSVGSSYGILTASHVLKKLPENEDVGVVRFPTFGAISQSLKISMAHSEKICMGEEPFLANGPDIAFLRLPEYAVDALNTRNIFFNLEKRREEVLSGRHNEKPYLDCVVGVIDERTKELPAKIMNTRLKNFEASVEPGKIISTAQFDQFDVHEFEPQSDPAYTPPSSYEGMSGSALWRVNCKRDDEGTLSMSNNYIVGVAFHQSCRKENKRIIFFHGYKSVYNNLINKINDSKNSA